MTKEFIFGLFIVTIPAAAQIPQRVYAERGGVQIQSLADGGFQSANINNSGEGPTNPFSPFEDSRIGGFHETGWPSRDPSSLAEQPILSKESTVSADELRGRSSKQALRAIAIARGDVAAGDRAAAIRELSRAVKKFPSDGRLRTNLGIEYLRAGQINAAVPELQEAARLFPDSSQTAANLADAYFGLAQWRAAEEQARRAARLDPANPRAHLLLGGALLEQGANLQEAIDHLKISTAEIPESRVLLASLYLRTGERSAAEQELRKFATEAKGGKRTIGERWLAVVAAK